MLLNYLKKNFLKKCQNFNVFKLLKKKILKNAKIFMFLNYLFFFEKNAVFYDFKS